MPTIGTKLRSFVLDSTSVSGLIATRMHQNTIPEESAYPHALYTRSGAVSDVDLDGTADGFMEETFDLEIYEQDSTRVMDGLSSALAIADALRSRLQDHSAARSSTAFGAKRVRGIFVDDHDDSFIPKGISDDMGVHLASFQITIFHDCT